MFAGSCVVKAITRAGEMTRCVRVRPELESPAPTEKAVHGCACLRPQCFGGEGNQVESSTYWPESLAKKPSTQFNRRACLKATIEVAEGRRLTPCSASARLATDRHKWNDKDRKQKLPLPPSDSFKKKKNAYVSTKYRLNYF